MRPYARRMAKNGWNFAEVWEIIAEQIPDAQAQVQGDRRFTWAAFDRRADAEPLQAVDELRGRIWRRQVPKAELPAVEREHAVISTKLAAGRTFVHVHADGRPGPEFDEVEPDLEDVYFSVMAGQHGAAARRPALEVAT